VTRNFYVGIAQRLGERHGLLKTFLFSFMIGGFALLLVLNIVTKRPDIVVGFGGRIWFSASVVIGVLWLATEWFNPVRDPHDKSLDESWAALVLNGMLLMAVAAWLIE